MAEQVEIFGRPTEVTQAPLETLVDVYTAKVNLQILPPSTPKGIPFWDVVWELHDRIHAINSNDGDLVRSRLFELIRNPNRVNFYEDEVESLVILFQTLGEQESRWQSDRGSKVKGSIPLDQVKP